ncbi:uncharacterized protein LOC110669882 [Hevea brasiliensis]|uniref:uncharacterized protein LOC110669882 n=1 Tax=Hevea brasiliensis TaxID=3981 RepID=UPI0025D1EDF3|nr:uncharacterized protein LOC110669882 [Hevea brasiliensis]
MKNTVSGRTLLSLDCKRKWLVKLKPNWDFIEFYTFPETKTESLRVGQTVKYYKKDTKTTTPCPAPPLTLFCRSTRHNEKKLHVKSARKPTRVGILLSSSSPR